METNLFIFIIKHNTITECKTIISSTLQIFTIRYKLSEVGSLNNASELELTHLSDF